AFQAEMRAYGKVMPWAGTEVPSATFRSRLSAADQAYQAQGKLLADARRMQADEKGRADLADENYNKAKKTFDGQIAAMKKQREVDLVSVGSTNVQLQKEVDLANADKNNAKTSLEDLKTALAKLETAKKRADDDLKAARGEAREAKEKEYEARDKLSLLKRERGVSDEALEAQQLDRNAVEELKTWKKDWRIVDMDRTGKAPYINLGMADRLQPQITFSVHEMGKDGLLNPVPKGTIEVVRTTGPKLAQATVTSVKDAKANPIVKGDYLFNPTWSPDAKTRVAVAGAVDLNEEKIDTTADFLRLLVRQNVEVEGRIDVADEKAPKLLGDVTSRTKYVVIADSLDQINHPKARDTVYRNAYDAMVKQMRDKAAANGVPVISLRKYLDMIGYRSPRVTGRAAP
ncbi:MAG: hypothetical protein ACRC33_26780, partial [Gemmataceae bacterium]